MAVFDADGTLWGPDLGDLVHQRLLAQGRLADAPTAREMARQWSERELPPERYWAYQAQSLAGLDVAEVVAVAQQVYDAQVRAEVHLPVRAIVNKLTEAGVRVVVSSASNRELLRGPLGRDFGILPENIYGMDVALEDRRGGAVFTDRLLRVNYGQGKVKTLEQEILRDGATMVLGVGDSPPNDGLFIAEGMRRHGALGLFVGIEPRRHGDLVEQLSLSEDAAPRLFVHAIDAGRDLLGPSVAPR